MVRRSLLGSAAARLVSGARTTADAMSGPVDVLLVLAIDASGSLSDERLTMQREGHARAVESQAFLDVVTSGHRGRVALAAVEWSNSDRQALIVPWTIVEDAESAWHFASALVRAPRPVPGFTSISGAIDFSVELLSRAPYAATRHVIDVSGNGTNNDGRPVARARNDAVAAGVTVNGLPILDAVGDLETYYARDVIGGPRAFTVVARDMHSFAQAVLRKLVLETAMMPSDQHVSKVKPLAGLNPGDQNALGRSAGGASTWATVAAVMSLVLAA